MLDFDKIVNNHSKPCTYEKIYEGSYKNIKVVQKDNMLNISVYSPKDPNNITPVFKYDRKFYDKLKKIADTMHTNEDKSLTVKLRSQEEQEEYNRLKKEKDKEVLKLILENKKLKEEIKLLKSELNKYKKHNVRGAGRKSKFTDDQVKKIIELSALGHSARQIAKDFDCSHTSVSKLIKLHK